MVYKTTSYEWVHGADLVDVSMRYREDVPTDLIVIDEHAVENIYHLSTKDVERGCLLDVGANIGSVSAWWLAAGGQTYAVEPNARNADVLIENLDRNSSGRNWHFAGRAVGANYGNGKPIGDGGGARVELTNSTGHGTVEVVPLDDLIGDAQKDFGQISVLKIDVEGAEVEAILASELLGDCLRLCVEFNDGDSKRIGQMMNHMAKTHSLSILGSSITGGNIWGHRYNAGF